MANLNSAIKMKEHIEKLIQEHKTRLDEVKSFLNELTATNTTKLTFEEKELVRKAVIELSVESDLRLSFIGELENLLF
jgi:hypothetical protein